MGTVKNSLKERAWPKTRSWPWPATRRSWPRWTFPASSSRRSTRSPPRRAKRRRNARSGRFLKSSRLSWSASKSCLQSRWETYSDFRKILFVLTNFILLSMNLIDCRKFLTACVAKPLATIFWTVSEVLPSWTKPKFWNSTHSSDWCPSTDRTCPEVSW